MSTNLRRCYGGAAGRKGLTLLELVVVIAILAALAGVLVPLLPAIMNKTHASTGATNLGEIAKAIQLYAAQNGDNYPDMLDSIVASPTSKIATYVLNNAGNLTANTLNSGDASALNSAGINNLSQMVESSGSSDTNWSPTFNPYDVAAGTMATMTTVSTGATVAFLDPGVAAGKLGVSNMGSTSSTNNGRFVVCGLGKFATCCGTTMDEAPVWYNPTAGQDPDSVYARFGLVFQTADQATGNALARARLVGIVEFAQWGTMTKDDNLSYFYSLK